MKTSAGLLMYRHGQNGRLEVLLVHPGGPFWAKKDIGAWTIPKGEYVVGEEALTAAQREFAEETGFVAQGEFLDLGTVKQAGGKLVRAWAFEGDRDAGEVRSNTFLLEWPPKSGRVTEFPEVDRAEWFSLEIAREKMLASQAEFLARLEEILRGG